MSSFWIQFVHGEPVSSRSLTELIKLKKEIEKQRSGLNFEQIKENPSEFKFYEV